MKQKKSKKGSGSKKAQVVASCLESERHAGLPLNQDLQVSVDCCSASLEDKNEQNVQFLMTRKSENSSADKCRKKRSCIKKDSTTDMLCDTKYRSAYRRKCNEQSELAMKALPSETISGCETSADGISQDFKSFRTRDLDACSGPFPMLSVNREMKTKQFLPDWKAPLSGEFSLRAFARRSANSNDPSEYDGHVVKITAERTEALTSEDRWFPNGEMKSCHLNDNKDASSLCMADSSLARGSNASVEKYNGDFVSKKRGKRRKSSRVSNDEYACHAVSCNQETLCSLTDRVPETVRSTDCGTNYNSNKWKDNTGFSKWKNSFQQVVNHCLPGAQVLGKGNYSWLGNAVTNWHSNPQGLDHLPFQSSMLGTFCDFGDLAKSSCKSSETPSAVVDISPELSQDKVPLTPPLASLDTAGSVDDMVPKKKKVPTATLR